MNCPNCNKSLPDGSIFCSDCGTRVSDSGASSKKVVLRFRESIANTNFLACAILMSIVAVVLAVSAVIYIGANDIWSAIFPGATAILALISAIAAWSIVIAKSASPVAIRVYNIYNVVMVIATTVTAIFAGILSFILFIVLVIGGIILTVLGNSATEEINKIVEALEGYVDMSSEEIFEFLTGGGIFIAVVGVVAILLIMFFAINSVLIYKNNSRYVKDVAESLENDSYSVKKYPKVRPWVFGVTFVAFGIAIIAYSAMTALTMIAEGGLLIASVLWFKSVHHWDKVVEKKEKPEKKPKAEKIKAPVEKIEKPVIEKPEEPKVEEPKVEELKVEEPVIEAPAVEEVKVEETVEPEKTEEVVEVVETAEITETAEASEPEAEPVAEEEKSEPEAEASEPEAEAEVESEESAEEKNETSEQTAEAETETQN